MPVSSTIRRIGAAVWELPPTLRPGMRVPGGVAAMDSRSGVIAPGGIGLDITCDVPSRS